MSKPEKAIAIRTDADLTSMIVEHVTGELDGILKTEVSDDYLKVFFEAKVSRRAVYYAAEALRPYGIPFHVCDDYDWDEWSIVGTAVTAKGTARAEIWSPGA